MTITFAMVPTNAPPQAPAIQRTRPFCKTSAPRPPTARALPPSVATNLAAGRHARESRKPGSRPAGSTVPTAAAAAIVSAPAAASRIRSSERPQLADSTGGCRRRLSTECCLRAQVRCSLSRKACRCAERRLSGSATALSDSAVSERQRRSQRMRVAQPTCRLAVTPPAVKRWQVLGQTVICLGVPAPSR
jgi:hypothetical protein